MKGSLSKDRPPEIIVMSGAGVSSVRDQSTVVVEAIDWEVRTGDYWVVAGLQGSGKTDFLFMAAGLMPPASGTYRLFGEEMPIFDEARLKTRLRLGLVFDSGQLFNHLTVAENVALPMRYHHNLDVAAAKAEVQLILERLELGPWAESTPGAIGRNWQKRVGLARALALRPDVLLVDNPLAGLDLRHLNWWLGLLDELSKGNDLTEGKPMTLVVTSADLNPWKKRARQFAILKDRRFTVVGSWAQLEAASEELLHELMAAGISDT